MKSVSGTLVTRWVLEEVKLMIFLGVDPLSSFNDLSNNLRPVRVKVFLLHFLGHSLGNIFLVGGVVKDGRAILSSTVVTLFINGCWIMCAVKEFNELGVRHDLRVELNPQSFGVACSSRTDVVVGCVITLSPGIPNGGLENTLILRRRVVFLENVFDSPKASPRERSDFVIDFGRGGHGVGCAVERLQTKEAF